MALLRQLLLLPLVAPLLAVLLVGAVNPRPAVSLRLLIWSTPPLPIGVWLMLAGAGGAGLSAVATGLALGQGAGPTATRRQVRRPVGASWMPWQHEAAATTPGPTERRSGVTSDSRDPDGGGGADGPWSGAAPSRNPGEPAPTVEARYRVLRRTARNTPTATGSGQSQGAASTPATRTAAAASDDWGQPRGDDW